MYPYKGLKGTYSQQGPVFSRFCPKQGIDLIFCFLNPGIDIINFWFLTWYLFLDDKQTARMFSELNYSKYFLQDLFDIDFR